MSQAFPLAWPALRPRTPGHRRRSAGFALSLEQSQRELLRELRLLNARDVVVSTNVAVRRDGLFYASGPEPTDPGVAVYFDRFVPAGCGLVQRRSFVIACDSYTRLRWNVRAVGVTIEALRAIARHGATEMLEQAFTGFAALPPAGPRHWSDVLGVPRSASPEVVRAEFRHLVKQHHPDAGGDAERFREVSAAFEAWRAEKGQ